MDSGPSPFFCTRDFPPPAAAASLIGHYRVATPATFRSGGIWHDASGAPWRVDNRTAPIAQYLTGYTLLVMPGLFTVRNDMDSALLLLASKYGRYRLTGRSDWFEMEDVDGVPFDCSEHGHALTTRAHSLRQQPHPPRLPGRSCGCTTGRWRREQRPATRVPVDGALVPECKDFFPGYLEYFDTGCAGTSHACSEQLPPAWRRSRKQRRQHETPAAGICFGTEHGAVFPLRCQPWQPANTWRRM